jgi:hypothetical protein
MKVFFKDELNNGKLVASSFWLHFAVHLLVDDDYDYEV